MDIFNWHFLPRQYLLILLIIHLSAATFKYPNNYYYCDDPGLVKNGYFVGPENFAVGASISFRCDNYHELYGAETVTCLQGQYRAYWSDNIPVCIPESDDSKTPGPRGGRKGCGGKPKTGAHAAEVNSDNSNVLEYECHNPAEDHISVDGDRVVYCYDKEWHGTPLECRRKSSCPDIQLDQNVLYEMSGTKEQDVIVFDCQKGFALVGNSHITCKSTGEWSGDVPTCEAVSCPYPSGIPYGQVRLTTSTEARYKCNKGYEMVGSENIWCKDNGLWSPQPPECEPVDCGNLTHPDNGYVRYSVSTYTHYAYYECNNGYNLIGSAIVRCDSNGNWCGDIPICQSKLCSNLQPPMHGMVSVPDHVVGSTATYSCSTGYILSGQVTRQCLSSTRWSGSQPTCRPVNCGSLPDPDNGEVIFTSTTFNSYATYNCDRDKQLKGSAVRICQANGEWSDTEPLCVSVIDCGEPMTITNGRVLYSTTFKDSLANYTCNDGYTLVGGDSQIRCTGYGKWVGQVPDCAAIDCGPPPTIEHGQATFSSTNFKSVATYTCNKRFSLQGNENTVICQANGQWKKALTTCIEINCGDPPIIPKAIPAYNSTNFMSEVSYSCEPGYTLVGGRSTLMCQANNMWFGDEPTCEAVDCGKPQTIDNGIAEYSSTTLTSVATYSCDDGYSFASEDDLNPTVMCNKDGEWEGQIPVCDVDCGLLQPPNIFTIIIYADNSTMINSTVNYLCQNGYVLSTDNNRTCTENGSWSEPEPICEPIDCGDLPPPQNGLIRFSTSTTLASPVRYACNFGFNLVGMEIRICQANGSWSGKAPTCQIIDCGSLNNPQNGRVQFNNTIFTSIAQYTCNTGYMLPTGTVGQRFCRDDSKWSGNEPICELINCGGLSNPANGRVTVSSTLLGDTANYTCDIGYNLNGSRSRNCGDMGMWSGDDPVCQIVNCGDPGILIDGQRTFFGTTYRRVANFFCNDGFNMIGDGLRRCEANGEWTGSVPDCKATVPTCGLPESPNNGNVYLEATVPGSQALYGCEDGYEIIGSDTRICGTNEEWSGNPPVCTRITHCIELDTPQFARRVGNNNEIGSVVYFICEDDYDTLGSNARRCEKNGQWSGTATSCVLRNESCSAESGETVTDSMGRLCQCVENKFTNCCRHRQDWLTLSTERRNIYTEAVLKVSSNELYKPFYTNLMQLYKNGFGTPALSFDSETSQFLPWHRYFLQQYEDLLRLIDPSVTIPYWDWTLSSVNPYINPVFSPQDGFGNSSDSNNCVQSGPFRKDEFSVSSISGGGCLERAYFQGFLLSRQQLEDAILTQPANRYSQFISLLNVPYISIRCAIGGTMCNLDSGASTDDPLHILIISFVDYIWDQWQSISADHKRAQFGTDSSSLVLTDNVPVSSYHDSLNLPNGVSVCYGDSVDSITGIENQKRSIEDMSCVSEDIMDRLSMSDRERHTIRAACRLLYSYISH